ncbi:MAG TPA: hypothetical protein VMW50_08295 [Dehalococcoidia bacterium]|nr:hypothetical protein [Dehalococcoidia bacterium]
MTVEELVQALEEFACLDQVKINDCQIAEVKRIVKPNEDAYVEIILERGL